MGAEREWEEEEKRRSHQIEARQEERRGNWTGARNQKPGLAEGGAEERGRCSAAPLLLCSLTGIPPALCSQRRRWPCTVLTHSPVHRLKSCSKIWWGRKEKGIINKTNKHASFHCVLAPALVPYSRLTLALSQSAGESVSLLRGMPSPCI